MSEARREAARHSLLGFAETYLPHLFNLPPSKMHVEIALELEDLAARPGGLGRKLAIAAPRGYAKSVLATLAYPLWLACTGRERFIAILSDTADQAADHLKHLRDELETNQRLLADYPEMCLAPGMPPGRRPGPSRWKKDDLVTASGVRVKALGAEQKIRGQRNKDARPGLIILDDIENEDLVRSAEQREKRFEWLMKSVLSAGTAATNFVAVGTVLHHDSVLARLLAPTKAPGWSPRKYKALISEPARADLWEKWQLITGHREQFEGRGGVEAARAYYRANSAAMEEGAVLLWPEKENLLALMELREAIGRAAFASEKQNDPISPGDGFIAEREIVYWEDPAGGGHASVEALLSALSSGGSGSPEVLCACDPSLGKAGRHHDDTAIIIAARDRKSGIVYVLDADIRRRKPDEIMAAIIEWHRVRKFTRVGIEEVQFQEFLKAELERRMQRELPRPPRVEGLKQTSDKLGRIQSLQPIITGGTLRFSRRHRALIDQLLQFPKGDHDDGPDALEMAVRMARRPMAYAVWAQRGDS